MKRSHSGFTLIELLVTISIIGILATLITPQVGKAIQKARSVKCASNLRQIGIAVSSFAQDNDNRFPAIESMPSDPVYNGADTTTTPKPIYEVLSPYGVTHDLLKCPSDLAGPNFYAKEGSSYQWRNFVDDEITTAPKIYSDRFGVRNPRASWLLLATDYDNVHSGKINRLYADGHVRSF